MEAWLSIEGPPDGTELTSLYRWLADDPDVRRRTSRPVVRIQYDGVSVTIDADTPEATEEVLRALGYARPDDTE